MDGRAYPFIVLSALYSLWLFLSGYTLPLNGLNIAVISYALWLSASLIWSDHPHSIYELLNWLSYLVLFIAGQALRIDIVLWCVFPAGFLFACMQLYRHVRKRGDYLFILGNPSHNSSFMLSGLFSCIWLSGITAGSLSLILFVLSIPIVFAITATKSKGGISAMLAGLLFLGTFLKSPFLLSEAAVIIFLIGLWLFLNRQHNWGFKGSWRERKLIFASTWAMIRQRPLIGNGLQSFRKLMPFAVANLHKKEWFHKLMRERSPEYKGDNIYANRVHNDHLETLVEVGVIGYALLIYIFLNVQFNIYSAGFLVMAIISSLWFFYFRNTHTAMPFWAVMGAASVGTAGFGNSILVLKATAAAIIVIVIMFIIRKFTGLSYFTDAVQTYDLNKKLDLTQKAIDCDPNNGDYLNYYAYCGFATRPVDAIYYTYKGIINYDGNRQIWGLWNILARCWFNMDKLKPAKWATENSLKFHPNYTQGLEMSTNIKTMQIILQNNKLGKVG